MFKAAIRVNKIKTVSQLRGATLHAERHDETGKARVRDGAEPGYGLAWSKADNDRDYLAAFKAHKTEMGAGERKNAPLCMQALCVVSPEWVEKAGDLHDAKNPHNQQLFDQAKAWAESWAGEGSVFGARLDLDEKGGAVVDLMISPVRQSRGKPVISTQKALTELKGLTRERNEYAALQTSWADWCRGHLDREIVRGTRKEITQRAHLSPETYGAVMDKARESLSEPPERAMEVLQRLELSEAHTAHLRDYLVLREEIARHKTQRSSYKPPEGDLPAHRLPKAEQRDPWPYIQVIRGGVERVINAAHRFGMGLNENATDRYENGKDVFPSLSDRMHLSAVVAKCFLAYAQAEAFVKSRFNTKGHKVSVETCWPQNAKDEVERHERNLGLAAPQVARTSDRGFASPEREMPSRSRRDRDDDRGFER